MKKIYTIVIVLVTVLLIATYAVFRYEVSEMQRAIEGQEFESKKEFLESKEIFLKDLESNKGELAKVVMQVFEIDEARSNDNVTVSYLFFEESLPRTLYQKEYLACVEHLSSVILKNNEVKEIFQDAILSLKSKHGLKLVDKWLENLGEEKFCSYKKIVPCNGFTTSVKEYSINYNALSEFDSFLLKYSTDVRLSQQKSKNEKDSFDRYMARTSKSLSYKAKKILQRQIDNTNTFENIQQSRTYKGKHLGNVKYQLSYKEYDNSVIDRKMKNVYKELYKNNSLYTGAMPYGYCYGRSNSCNSYGCSQVKVQAPYNSDVLVTIKKSGKVYRHAYIKSGGKYVFELPNGTYQTFFYYGKGWNPKKLMKRSPCGGIKGGFIRGEAFGKDNSTSLYNNILTYELILQSNGNFSTKPSSANEAF